MLVEYNEKYQIFISENVWKRIVFDSDMFVRKPVNSYYIKDYLHLAPQLPSDNPWGPSESVAW